MTSLRTVVRAERLRPAFDLLAAYEPGGFFLERAGVGVAGSAGRPWGMAISGPQMRSSLPTLEDLFAGFDVEALPIGRTGSPAVRVDPVRPGAVGSVPVPRSNGAARSGRGDLGAAVGRR